MALAPLDEPGRPMPFLALFLAVLLLAPAPLHGQEPLALPRLGGPVNLDGRSEEAAWEAVRPLPLTMYQPTFEGIPTERTEIRVAYDASHLYVAGRFYDAAPEAVRATSLYRDQAGDSDVFTLVLDTFDDNENALVFWTTPAGVRGDYAVSADGRSSNSSWNTYWDVATVRTEDGWFAELRIPFSSLGFQAVDGQTRMGLIASRRIARKNEVVVFPAIPNSWSVTTPSRAHDVVLDGVRAQTPIYVTPYVLGGMGQDARLNDAETAYRMHDDVARDLGLDIKYNLTSNLTLDLTVNTDFAQAEADDQQVNLTRFSLFFPEKRQFFQERAGLFQFNTRNERLFHSRRIGLDGGRAVPILGGARLVGRSGQWDLGLLSMQTASSGGLPSENFGVMRLRRQVFNDNSTAGVLLTSRTDLDGRYNLAYGLDGIFRVVGDEYLSLHWAQTFDEAAPGGSALDRLRAGLFEARWERRRLEGWSYWSSATWAGRAYQPDLGFLRRRDYAEVAGRLHYNGFPGQDSPFRQTMPFHLDGFAAFRNADGSIESAGARFLPMAWFKNGASVMVMADLSYEDLRHPLTFLGASTVEAGSYTFLHGTVSYTTSNRGLARAGLNLGAGSFYDGWRLTAGVQPEWNPSPHLQLSGSYALNRVRFGARGEGFDAHLAGLRVQAALDTRASASVFVQYNSAFDVATANVRLRYNFREGSDLWIVYNEGLNTDRDRLVPTLPLSNERTLLLKYTYTFDARSL